MLISVCPSSRSSHRTCPLVKLASAALSCTPERSVRRPAAMRATTRYPRSRSSFAELLPLPTRCSSPILPTPLPRVQTGRALRLLPRRQYATPSDLPPSFFPRRPPAPPPAPPSAPAGPSSSAAPALTYTPPRLPRSALPRPRLDVPALLASPGHTTANFLARRTALPLGEEHIHHLARVREQQLDILRKLERARRRHNEISAEIKGLPAKYKGGAGGVGAAGDAPDSKARMAEERDELVQQAKKLKNRSTDLERHLEETEAHLQELALALPNWTHPSVPLGPEDRAVELERFGPKPLPASSERDHLDICHYWDLVDTEASATTTGSSWPYLKGALALLEQALINYALSVAIRHGFTPVAVPDVVKSDIAWRCGFAPRDSGGAAQTYFINADSSAADGTPKAEHDAELCLAGTAEISLAGLFADRILPAASLPAMVVGVGRAFRAEAGARGHDTRGLYRVHQFSKVELFAVTAAPAPRDGHASPESGSGSDSAPESASDAEAELPVINSQESEAMMVRMAAVQKEIAQGLGLSVRVLDMPTEELGASAYRKWDMEAWMPGRGKWGEARHPTDTRSTQLTQYRSPPPPTVSTTRRGASISATQIQHSRTLCLSATR